MIVKSMGADKITVGESRAVPKGLRTQTWGASVLKGWGRGLGVTERDKRLLDNQLTGIYYVPLMCLAVC